MPRGLVCGPSSLTGLASLVADFVGTETGCVYDYKSHGQHAKVIFGVLSGIFHGIIFSKISLNPLKIVWNVCN